MFSRKFGLLALFLALAALMFSFGFGCGGDDSPTESTDDGETDGDDVTDDDDVIDDEDDDDIINQDSLNRELSMELVAEANDSLARQMNEIINETIENADSSFRPGDIDFSGVNSIYEEALVLWPENPDAKFGVAFTGLMLFCADPDLNQLVDDFKYYYDTMSFNPMEKVMLLPEVGFGRSAKMFPDGIPIRPGGMLEIMPAFAKLDHTLIATATAIPMISDIQYNLENYLLPKIIDVEECLIDLLADPNYTFTITPLMQGNPGSSPIVVDQSDFSLFLGVAYAAEAALHIFFARNLDVADYTAEAVEDAINQGSDFLTLKDGVGQTHMTTAKNRILSAEAQFETTIDHLLDEIGTDQSYDLITVYPSDEADLIDIKDSLIHYRSFMDEVKELTIHYSSETLVVEVALWKFFDDPMVDPKEFLPGYTITLEAYYDPDLLYACYEWTANTFEEWNFPDPTCNGLVPSLTNSELKDLVMMDYEPGDWIKSDCDYLELEINW